MPELLMWDSIVRILLVFERLINLKPDFQTIVQCVHTENFLKRRLDLIRNDLSALPQSLEKDFPKTSAECRELIEELRIAEIAYGVQLRAYLAPHMECPPKTVPVRIREYPIRKIGFLMNERVLL